jgi:hypothetical protein
MYTIQTDAKNWLPIVLSSPTYTCKLIDSISIVAAVLCILLRFIDNKTLREILFFEK